ncbi:MAG: gamma-glutamyl-gamma-aminobutyrate hydrolase family protein [Cellvibrio sp.]|nr:gamma-glutamyl-gamma-aminobutyrate hydrolase family protein [Cellvibrio sp.]
MRAHYLQHVAFEGLGSIEDWLCLHRYQVTCTKLFESANFPDVNDIDLLIIMGGPMSVNDENDLPWLTVEKQFVRSVIDAGKPVLGICLGAQMIANVMGASVYPNSKKEIGWFSIYSVDSQEHNLFCFPVSAQAFHWHGETFDLPKGAHLLASSQACVNQAFQLGSNVIGLQFHLETTPESLNQIATHCGDELVAGEFIQSADEMKKASQADFDSINHLMVQLLDFITRKN